MASRERLVTVEEFARIPDDDHRYELVEGRVVNQITVDPETAEGARIALQRMLDIT